MKLMSSKYECRFQGWESVHGPITDQFSQKRSYLHNIPKIKKEENLLISFNIDMNRKWLF